MRVYEKNGKKYLSVTSVLELMFGFDKRGFDIWAAKNHLSPDWISKQSVELGNKYHEYFENAFYGISEWADRIDTPEDQKVRDAVDDFFDQGWEITKSEQEIYCDEYMYAGRYDLLGRNERLGIENALLDVKSWGAWKHELYKRPQKKIEKLEIQESMYAYGLHAPFIPLFLVVPQVNGKCIVERMKYTDSWKRWINEHSEEISKLLQVNTKVLTSPIQTV